MAGTATAETAAALLGLLHYGQPAGQQPVGHSVHSSSQGVQDAFDGMTAATVAVARPTSANSANNFFCFFNVLHLLPVLIAGPFGLGSALNSFNFIRLQSTSGSRIQS